jgi:hypothetical protein
MLHVCHEFTMQCTPIRPNLELKTRPKQFLGYLLLEIVLPRLGHSCEQKTWDPILCLKKTFLKKIGTTGFYDSNKQRYAMSIAMSFFTIIMPEQGPTLFLHFFAHNSRMFIPSQRPFFSPVQSFYE